MLASQLPMDSQTHFRTNPHLELALTERLSPEDRAAFEPLRAAPGLYGVARDRRGTIQRAVDCDTALLLHALRDPGPLPTFARQHPRGLVTRMVLDSLLEIRLGEEFVCGPRALERLQSETTAHSVGVLGRLAHRALQYAQSLDLRDLPDLTLRLYTYHRFPLAPRHTRQLPDEASVERFLRIDTGGGWRPLLEASWKPGRSDRFGWLGWRRRNLRHGRAPGGGATYKLYLSPRLEDLPRVFARLLEVLPATTAHYFKVGSTAVGLLRPDKLVVYFKEYEGLAAAVDMLSPHLKGVAVQGVPFSAELTADGLLSWGADPPEAESTLPAEGGSSWRLWIVHQLASALLEACNQPSSAVPPWRFALERLRLEGIDVEHWTASPTLWRQAQLARI